MISAAHHRKPNPQKRHLLLHQSWDYGISDRSYDTLRGFESGCEGNRIDDEQSDRGFGNAHDEASEISHAVNGKYPLQSSREAKAKDDHERRKVMRSGGLRWPSAGTSSLWPLVPLSTANALHLTC
jgi:hypothetical protein